MTVRRRTTEKHPHPIWEKLISTYKIVEIEGFLFESTKDELINATLKRTRTIPIHCIESFECDINSEADIITFFTEEQWHGKIHTSKFFGTTLKIILHIKGDSHLFKVYEVDLSEGKLIIKELIPLETESHFVEWWKTIKKLDQTKKQVEARERQALTIIDGLLEKNGLQWGGNVDGFLLKDNLDNVLAIIELRQSRKTSVTKYDPADYFLGTYSKGGDFYTWLPLLYLQKTYNLPLILITVSTLENDKIGFTEVKGMSEKRLAYVNDISPKSTVTNDFTVFKKWLDDIIAR